MFASEGILLNPTVACLEFHKNASKWIIRDVIVTTRAIYFFAGTRLEDKKESSQKKRKSIEKKGNKSGSPQRKPQVEIIANYLNCKYERLDITNFRALKMSQSRAIMFFQELRNIVRDYSRIFQLLNKTTGKNRYIACQSQEDLEQFFSFFNLIAAYRTLLSSNSEKSPHYITDFVKNYKKNKGELLLDNDILQETELQHLLTFGRENESIKQLTFTENFNFDQTGQNQRKIDILNQFITMLNGESVNQIKFIQNFLTDNILLRLASSFSNHSKLTTLEITYNLLSSQCLEILGQEVFKNNKNLRKIILNNNQIAGINANTMTIFLEDFLAELEQPEVLDLSYNRLSDQCLYPIVKYLFANTESKILMLNVEHNNFTNKANRTIAQAYMYCTNTNLKAKFGPLPLTQKNLKICFELSKSVPASSPLSDVENVEVCIRRKPVNLEQGLSYLPTNKDERQQLQKYIERIRILVQLNQQKVTVEEIRELVFEITLLHFEFPRHLLEPIFNMVNIKCTAAIFYQDIYSLEILLDTLALMNARNEQAEKVYESLSHQAETVARNLIRAINMEIHDDHELLRVLVENIEIAKKIGMRGEVIDVAVTLKALCTKLLQEMVKNQANNSEDEDDKNEVFMLKEEDLRSSVYDPKYSRYAEIEDAAKLGLASNLESNLAYHPYQTDYIKIVGLNLQFLKKNMTIARKLLFDEETYALKNIYTRCAFLLSDGLPDMALNLNYNSIRDDQNIKIARLLFRYRWNLDNLFPKKLEPQINPEIVQSRGEKGEKLLSLSEGVQKGLYIEDYTDLLSLQKAQSLIFQASPIQKPLSRINSLFQDKALKFNDHLHKIHALSMIQSHYSRLYRQIQTLFEEFVIKKGVVASPGLADEFYLQIYKKCNYGQQKEEREAIKIMFLILTLLSSYLDPSENLKPLYMSWLERKASDKQLKRFVETIFVNFKTNKMAEGKLFINWPPCLMHIEALEKHKPLQIQVVWPSGDQTAFPMDEQTTIESLMTLVYKEKFFQKEIDKDMYWLFINDEEGFPFPVSKDKKILKLIYKDEHEFSDIEEGMALGQSRSSIRRLSVVRRDLADAQNRPQFMLYLRKRVFTSLHNMLNFKFLSLAAKNFLFQQIRTDYIEKEILVRPSLSVDNAILLASLALKIKFQTKILRSKENSLTIEIITKNLNYCLPKSLIRDKQFKDVWPEKISKAFEDYKLKELTLQEAQDQFLILLASYDFMFGSYFLIKFNNTTILQKTITKFQQRKQVRKVTMHRDDDSDSGPGSQDSESEENSSESEIEESKKQDSPAKDKDKEIQNTVAKKRLDVFQEHFQNTSDEILLICKQDGLFFVDNRKREKIFLQVPYQDLIYAMGKGGKLKLGLLIKKKLNFDGQMFDARSEFICKNARVVAEDIMAYCQLFLIERSKSSEYIEIVKKNAIDMFNQDQEQDLEFTGNDSLEKSKEQGKPKYNIVVDDDLLKGKSKLFKAGTADLIAKSAKTQQRMQREKSFNLSQDYDSNKKANVSRDDSKSPNLVNTLSDDQEEDESFFGESKRIMSLTMRTQNTAEKQYERKLNKQIGNLFKFKQPNFLIYFKKHPCYVSNAADLEENQKNKVQNKTQLQKKETEKKEQTQEQFKGYAGRTISQIDEESERESDAENETKNPDKNFMNGLSPRKNKSSGKFDLKPREEMPVKQTPNIQILSPSSSAVSSSTSMQQKPNKDNSLQLPKQTQATLPQNTTLSPRIKQSLPENVQETKAQETKVQEDVKEEPKPQQKPNYAAFLQKMQAGKEPEKKVEPVNVVQSQETKPVGTTGDTQQIKPGPLIVPPNSNKTAPRLSFENVSKNDKKSQLNDLLKKMAPPK